MTTQGRYGPFTWFRLRSWIGTPLGGPKTPVTAHSWHVYLRDYETEHTLAANLLDCCKPNTRLVVVGKCLEPKPYSDGSGRVQYRLRAFDIGVSMRSRTVTVGKAPPRRRAKPGVDRVVAATKVMEGNLAELEAELDRLSGPAPFDD